MNKRKEKNKIELKDYIEYGLIVISILVAIVFGLQKQELVENTRQINQSTQIIQQNNYYNQLPIEIRVQIENIAEASGNVVTFAGDKK
jgi:hypothetical protein